MSLKQFADTLPDYAKDIRLNLGSILSDQLLGEDRKLGLLLACAHGRVIGRWSPRPRRRSRESCPSRSPMPPAARRR